jgi:hypothetical protein
MKIRSAVFAVLIAAIAGNIEAQRRAGGGSIQRSGGGQINRSAASTSIRSDPSVNRSASVNRDVNVNRNVDRNVDVDRDLDVHRGVDADIDYDRWGHPVARGVTAGVTAGLAYGATVAMLPSNCSTVVVNGIGYSQCGSTWYQPYYSGTNVEYVVVMPPN